uniref:Uncharacterized protein n=1 Tax=Oryza barthii TaxID=65489 RepID=A0A0D3FYD0_9ORYZ
MLVRLEAEEEAVALRAVVLHGWKHCKIVASPDDRELLAPLKPTPHQRPVAAPRAGGGSQSELRPTQGRAGGRRPAEERAQASTRGEQVGGKRLTGAASREAAAGRQTSTGWLTQRVGGGEDRTARFGAQVCIDIDFPSPTPPKTERTGESWNCRTMHRKEAIKTVYREVGGECKDGSTIGIDMNSHNTSVKECLSKTEVVTTDSCPDRESSQTLHLRG